MGKTIIGRKDKVDFPELDLYHIDAKIDTGAYTSSLHCHHIRLIEGEGGKQVLHFKLLDPAHKEYNDKDFFSGNFNIKNIKSSTGNIETRFIIKTTIKIFNEEIMGDFSLTDRESMKYPVLIGRKLLRNRYIVDVSKKNLSYSAGKKIK